MTVTFLTNEDKKYEDVVFHTYNELKNYPFKGDTTYRIHFCGELDELYSMGLNKTEYDAGYTGTYVCLYDSATDAVTCRYLLLTPIEPNNKTYKLDIDASSVESRDIVTDSDGTEDWTYCFNITDDGELSVKSWCVNELPVDLDIPEVVNEIAVNRLANGMFMNNTRIQSVTLPDTINEIPDECFNEAINLRHIYNTGNIRKIGTKAFRWTRLEKAVFPNLQEFGVDDEGVSLAFSNVPHLAYADVGKVTTIPNGAFKHCTYLSKIAGDNVTSVQDMALMNTLRLVNVDFINNLTSIGNRAFWWTKYSYDWNSLTQCTFDEEATYAHMYPTDFWSGIIFMPCERLTPTALCQQDPRWRDKQYGVNLNPAGHIQTYNHGCLQMATMHAYCGLNNLEYSSVYEFEDVVKGLTAEGETVTIDGVEYDNYLEAQNATLSRAIPMIEKLGYNVTLYNNSNDRINGDKVAEIYRILAMGGYVIASLNEKPYSHAVLIYGINDKGEMLVLDSNRRYPYDETKAYRYKLPFNRFMAPDSSFVTITKPIASGVLSINTNNADETKLDFNYRWTCPEDKFVKAGILVVNIDNYDEDTFYAGTEDINVYDRSQGIALTNPSGKQSWTKTQITPGQTWVAKSYVQYRDDNGQVATDYSDTVEFAKV